MEAIYNDKKIDAIGFTEGNSIPVGCILIWSGNKDNIPDGWALCDGEDGRPDLRNRFVIGAGLKYSSNDTGGAETVKLTINQIPKHSHTYTFPSTTALFAHATTTAEKKTFTASYTTDSGTTGGDGYHPNMPPYYALCYIIKL